jgi:hypothetical protein
MILQILAAIGLFSLHGQAEMKAEIVCTPRKSFLGEGSVAEIVTREDGGYEYVFAHPSLPIIAPIKFDVALEATKQGTSDCEIDVVKKSDGSHRFFVRQSDGGKLWKLNLPESQKLGDMNCKVKESLRRKLCEPAKQADTLTSPPACTDANSDSSLCNKESDAN